MSKENSKYPFALYAKGWEDLSATVTVHSEKEEEEARAKGYKGLGDPVEEKKPTAAEKAAAEKAAAEKAATEKAAAEKAAAEKK